MFRYAKICDRDELYALWQLCFHDSDVFADWFFSERFLPEYCPVWEENGRIVCAMHSLPLHMRVRDAVLPCVEIAGVATLPEYRGQGLMRATFTQHLAELRRSAIPLVSYRPVDFAIYRSLHHYAVADKIFITLPASAPLPIMPTGYDVYEINLVSQLEKLQLAKLHKFYNKIASRYSGMISRSYADFMLKYRDYACDGVKCAVVYHANELAGYCFYSFSDDVIESVECLADCGDAYTALGAYLVANADKRELKMALPPDSGIELNGQQKVTQPRTTAGVTDVAILLKSTGLDGFAIAIRDDIITENNGVYSLNGTRSKQKPQLMLDSGRLAQLIFGYASLSELAFQGAIKVIDSHACNELDAVLPKLQCYCIEEY
jgi:Predicted acetyltransferase involved in intracellular survival and related acetyltransferases